MAHKEWIVLILNFCVHFGIFRYQNIPTFGIFRHIQ